jgi:hypothetical protein
VIVLHDLTGMSHDLRHQAEWLRVLELHHNLFLLMYITVAGTFLASFAAHFAATGVALAAAWIVLASGVIYTERRRLFPSAEE